MGDFPLDGKRLRDLSRQDAAGRDAVVSALAKPAAWQRFEPASNTLTSLLHDLRSLAPEAAPGLIAATVLGIIRLDLPPQVAVDRAAALLAITINAVGPFGDVPVPVVIEASRAALRQAPMPLPDLLPNATARILRADTADGGFGAKHGTPHLRADNGW